MSERTKIMIATEQLPYPDSLGNNGDLDIRSIAHGCSICQLFLENGAKEPLPFAHILRETSEIPEFLEICKSSKHCGKLLDKFKNGTYKALYQGGQGDDDILVVLRKKDVDIYDVIEGKHRVCVAKRFGIKEIPVLFSVVEYSKQ